MQQRASTVGNTCSSACYLWKIELNNKKKNSYIIEINWSELTGAECRWETLWVVAKKHNIERKKTRDLIK